MKGSGSGLALFFMAVWAGNAVVAHSMVGHCPTGLAEKNQLKQILNPPLPNFPTFLENIFIHTCMCACVYVCIYIIII